MYKKSSSIKEKSFTVIELLVVIALIGLLASIVLVSFNLPEKRYRANVAKSLQFSQSIQNAIGIDAAGWWNFDDEITDGKVTDTSGNGNTGNLCDSTGCGVGKGPSRTDNTPDKVAGTGGGKYALSFDGGDDYVRVENLKGLQGASSFTVEGWWYPTRNFSEGSYSGALIKSLAPDGYEFHLGQEYNRVCFILRGNDGLLNFVCGGSNEFQNQQNKWHHLVGVLDNNKMLLYFVY